METPTSLTCYFHKNREAKFIVSNKTKFNRRGHEKKTIGVVCCEECSNRARKGVTVRNIIAK